MTGEPEVRVLDDPDSTARAAAEAIADALRVAISERGRADWATTGGSTPIGIYRALVEPPLRDAVPWASVHTWWGDDRYVPRTDSLSNVLPFDEVLAPGVPAARDHAHPIGMDEALAEAHDTAWAASRYDTELQHAGLTVDGSGFPVLDVVLVGIGADGHVLSVFPGSPLLEEYAWAIAVPAPTHIEPHVARVSLNPGILAAARLPMLVAHGAGKAAILASVLGGARDVQRWPAQVARRAGAIWFLDRAAAADLPR
ncbi:MAG TPA: 6-phosphogluconolactonase [Candidatus Dormibacteraeota bacterium]|nr:6-phosphogluconolactonase [Candidatus Dormibacteraeota bacterium]